MGLFPLRSAVFSLITSLAVVMTAAGQQPKGADAKPALSATLPAWLEKLNLSAQQKGQIETIVSQHDAQFAATWNQFGERYQETLRTEATVLATIEENLTDTQRQQAHEQRQKMLLSRAADRTANGEGEVGLGVALTAEQEALGRKIQEKVQARLNTLGSEVQLLHNRLLSIEMDKLVEIEKVLTKEQREQLSQQRQAALTAALDADSKAPAKTK